MKKIQVKIINSFESLKNHKAIKVKIQLCLNTCVYLPAKIYTFSGCDICNQKQTLPQEINLLDHQISKHNFFFFDKKCSQLSTHFQLTVPIIACEPVCMFKLPRTVPQMCPYLELFEAKMEAQNVAYTFSLVDIDKDVQYTATLVCTLEYLKINVNNISKKIQNLIVNEIIQVVSCVSALG